MVRFAAALVVAFFVGAGLSGTAAADPACSYDGGLSQVNASLGAGESATLEVTGSGAILFGGSQCDGVATNGNTDKIVVTGPGGSTEHLIIDQFNGPLAPGATVEGVGISEIEVVVGLGDASDEIVVRGSPNQEHLHCREQGRRLRRRRRHGHHLLSAPQLDRARRRRRDAPRPRRAGRLRGRARLPRSRHLACGQPGRFLDGKQLRRPALRRRGRRLHPRLRGRRHDRRRSRRGQAERRGRERLHGRRPRSRRLLRQLRGRRPRRARRRRRRAAERRPRHGRRRL